MKRNPRTMKPGTERETGTELEPGKYYLRPCVRTRWPSTKQPVRWIPVLGPPHSDAEIIKFSPRHFHADFRFLPRKLQEASGYPDTEVHHVFRTAVTIAYPHVPGKPAQPVQINFLPTAEFPTHTFFQERRVQFNGNYPEYPDRHIPWLEQLTETYQGQRLQGEEMVCPHRGASLKGIAPGNDGLISCPLHGLRFDPATGIVCGAKSLRWYA